jgi:hypothetical protein
LLPRLLAVLFPRACAGYVSCGCSAAMSSCASLGRKNGAVAAIRFLLCRVASFSIETASYLQCPGVIVTEDSPVTGKSLSTQGLLPVADTSCGQGRQPRRATSAVPHPGRRPKPRTRASRGPHRPPFRSFLPRPPLTGARPLLGPPAPWPRTDGGSARHATRSLERSRVIRGGYRHQCHSIVLPAGRSWR